MIPATLLYVFGDAPVARALARIGEAAGYDVVATTDPGAAVPPDAGAVVIASHGRDEEQVLAAAARSDVPYIALVASRTRGAAVLATADLTDAQRGRVRTPAGLDIGARTAPDVAVSILAEVIATRSAAPRPAPVPARPALPVDAAPLGTAVDPVCGMTVAVSAASLSHEHGDRTYYFCGSGCRAAFADDPARYGA